ncbi:hypothetical protein [Actibacterium sp. 188UL27-1]|uniref:hypothetical protein n=1 Tax=Actibacterium sp. 188UL27-1 TaxID=2786961 RepID=UPI00195CEE98|nr:hypothetical protein [Actibacterium sp. 188UL27-1]MBM7066528.1 hypothetical protein [Actibacterium sp. 188UL27-1]
MTAIWERRAAKFPVGHISITPNLLEGIRNKTRWCSSSGIQLFLTLRFLIESRVGRSSPLQINCYVKEWGSKIVMIKY